MKTCVLITVVFTSSFTSVYAYRKKCYYESNKNRDVFGAIPFLAIKMAAFLLFETNFEKLFLSINKKFCEILNNVLSFWVGEFTLTIFLNKKLF